MSLTKEDYCYYRTKYCMYMNACDKGEKCQFAHNDTELEPVKCWYDKINECYNKECYFWHFSTETINDYNKRRPKVNIKKPFYRLNNSVIIEKQQNNIIINTNDDNIDNIIKKTSQEKIDIETLNEGITYEEWKKSKQEKKEEINLNNYTYDNWLKNQNKKNNQDIVVFDIEQQQNIPINQYIYNDYNYTILKIKINFKDEEDFFKLVNDIDDKIIKIEKMDTYIDIEVYVYKPKIEVYRKYIFQQKENKNNVLKNDNNDSFNLPF